MKFHIGTHSAWKIHGAAMLAAAVQTTAAVRTSTGRSPTSEKLGKDFAGVAVPPAGDPAGVVGGPSVGVPD